MTVAAKLFVNDREVVTMCGRRSVDHRGTVTVEFGSEGGVVPVYTNERVESIRVDVWENNAFLATTYIPVPSPLRTLSLIDRTPYHLSFSGRPQTTTSYADEWTSGSVEVDVSWGVDNDGNSLGPKTQKNDDAWEKVRSLGLGSEVFGVTGLSTKSVIDVRKWMEWIQDQPIDPLDPRSTRLIQLREVIQRVSSHADIVALKASRKVFRMDIPKWLKAVTLEIAGDIPMDLKRFTLLMRRKERQTAGEAPVPLLEQEVDERMMKLSVQRPQEEEHPIPLIRQLSRQSSALSSFNLTRTPSSTLLPTHPPHQPLPKFLHRTLTNRLLHRTHTPRPKTFDDFVQEVKFIKFPNQTFFLFDWLRPRRRLCPDRRPGSAVSHVGRDGECRLLVQVSRAYNIPVRKDVRGKTVSFEPTLMSSSPPLGEGVDPSHYVRPFVEVTFQQQRVRTSASEGPDPYWNETLALHIPLASETDLDTDVIHFNVFDEVVVDVQKPGLSNEEYTYQRRERNWIGAVTVPFATVHEQKRVAGEFLLKLPLASLGYEYPVPSPSNTLSGDRTTSSEREDRKCPNTILHMFIALDPALPLPAEIPFQTTSTEPAPLLRHATHFLASLPHPYHNTTNTHPREITLTTSTLSGQTTFTTRFIRPQKPPPTLPHTLPSLLRYVSLIPYLASRTLYAASSHRIWATTDQFLSIGAGDLAEHAVLLCNYLKYAGVKAWVVLGRDVPRGRTAWVLVCDEEGWKVCNPVEGDVFDVGDRWCPLVEVGCVFDETNVWANLQQYADPARITFDFDNTRHWKPFVSRGMRVPELTSVQIEEPLYHPIDNERLQELEAYLEESVVDAVEDWRGTQMTRWNRLVSRTFAGLLPTFESSLCTPNPTAPIPDLSRIRTVYKLKGSPLSVPYTDASAVISAVNATNVHASVDEDVEFACAVWCSAYPGNVIGVWVWVAALTRGR
ncbi:hypothetical protein BC832DRAFT_563214 [Gaertneriomyces semiglobifer]|nr:hypothetical protein BC832DRAFT_563214 [Gaertneriomyces semiglobifer]